MHIKIVIQEDGGEEVPVIFLNTESAVAADYVSFFKNVTDLLLSRKEELEAEAGNSGRTIKHPLFDSVGAISCPTNHQ